MTKGAKIGCGCIGAVLVVIGGVAALFFGVFGALKGSDAYKHALATAQEDAQVLAITGSPLEPGMMPSGSINLENQGGTADLEIGVSGPDGAGVVHVVGAKEAGAWTYSVLDFTAEDGTKVNLLTSGGGSLAP